MMFRAWPLLGAIVLGISMGSSCFPSLAAGLRPNVLFIAVDDLRPELACYGKAHIHSPHIDRLAASGRLFEHAYCQQSVCNPSRTSLMTGMRPDSIGVTGNHSHFRTDRPDVVTLPEHFKNHGYHAAAIGKIYHGVFPDGASATEWDTMGDPQSWSVPAIRFGPRYYYTEEGIAAAKSIYDLVYKPQNSGPNDWTSKLVFGLATEAPDVSDATLYDGKVAEAAVEAIKRLKRGDKPFFLAVGFIKPHSPYIAPKKYFDLYQDVDLPLHPNLPIGAPTFSGHGSRELRRYTDQPNSGPIPENKQRRVRQAYFACISYIDAQIGRVMGELERSGLSKDTIVVLYGDHGYHLGEQGLWGKTTNFELDTRVPLIIRVPGMNAAGESSLSLVELVDLYPTLAELCGLPIMDQLEGDSFVSILDDPMNVTKSAAFSQYPRKGEMMGYSMRTRTHRLTQWVNLPTGEIRSTELYDYADGVIETTNTADSSPQLVQKLTAQLTSVSQASGGGVSESVSSGFRRVVSSSTVGFEGFKAGELDKLETTVGIWESMAGLALIDDKHAKTGKHCLHMTGGGRTSVILEFAPGTDTTGELSFWAERWTKRAPFSFRIEKNHGNGWTEFFNGDAAVRVGRAFLSHVRVPLGDDSIKQLRFTVTSPVGTGILIDDVRVAPAHPQAIVSVEQVPLMLPALVGTDASPLLKLKIETTGSRNPIRLTELQAAILSEEGDVESVQVYSNGANSQFMPMTSFGDAYPLPRPLRVLADDPHARAYLTFSSADFTFVGRQSLVEGANYVWVACTLKKTADINHRVGAMCRQVTFSNGETMTVDADPSMQRMGVALRKAGDDGVHTFRIPGLATTLKGTLIGVYDVRRRSGGDLPGDIDVGMSRSTDGGRTWEPMKIIMDAGDDPHWRYDGIGDPAILVDKNTGTIWVASTWSHGDRSWRGSGPGLKPLETGQLMLVRSDDDGVNWSKPINITTQVKEAKWSFILQGPGKGITMRDGTIVFAAQYLDPPEEERLPHSTIIYSQDHGETWQVGTGAFDDTTESQVVEVEPGVLMLNCRYNRKASRVVMTTRDMGETWQKHTTSERALIEPGSCMASLIDVGQEVGADRGGWLLFSNPDSTDGRHHITIKASHDRGLTWPEDHRLLLDEGNSAGYSCLTMIDEKTIGILYEGSQAHMTFQRIPLADIIDEVEPPDRPASNDSEQSLFLPRVFGDHMVLQADSEIPIWGKARPGAEVMVTLGTESQTVVANVEGKWTVRFQARKASKMPSLMSIEASAERVQFADVLIGEVWVCAGQSNMEWSLSLSANGSEEIERLSEPVLGDSFTERVLPLRILHLVGGARGSSGSYTSEHLARLTPARFCEGEWKVSSAESARHFSAVAWFFGRRLQEELDVPVGLICPAVGGTPTESWISREALGFDPNLKGLVAGNWLDNDRLSDFCRTRGQENLLDAIQMGKDVPADECGPHHSFKPGFMWSAGIEPLIPYAIRGVIWYQGESNAETSDRVREHGRLLPLLIKEWRKHWGQGEFPFLYAQLPAMNRPEWPRFREGQRRILQQVNHVGMAVTIDTGHRTNVHPTLKKPIGERLARLALGTTYRLNSFVPPSGPLLDVVERHGDSLVVSFKHFGEGLKSSDNKAIRHFEVCGDDGVFHRARAEIMAKDALMVSSRAVPEPQDVRYAWLPYPDPTVNLVNSVLLPASPFSTETEKTLFAKQEKSDLEVEGDNTRPNILLIVSEDNGPELGCYGDQWARTPNLDRLAADGVRFETAYVTQSVCSSSRSTIFTGLYPHQNGQIGLATHQFEMFRAWPSTYSILKAAGYRTGLLGKTHVNPPSVIEDHVDFRRITSANFAKKNLGEYAKESAVFINASNRPFFLTVNLPDAHWPVQNEVEGRPQHVVSSGLVGAMPYVGFNNDRLRRHVTGFYNCMSRLDECVGELLKALDKSGKADNTLVIYIGDHGAQFARGKVFVTEGGLRIPFIIRWPGKAESGLLSKQLVSTIDLLPTIVTAAGGEVPDHVPGKDLSGVLNGQSEPIRHYLFGERNCDSADLHFPQRAIRDSRYKLIKTLLFDRPDPGAHKCLVNGASNFRGSPTYEELKSAEKTTQVAYGTWLNPPEYQLYDLEKDRHEFINLASDPEMAEIRLRLIERLDRWQMDTDDRLRFPELLVRLTKENDACHRLKIRSPIGGWKYTEYLAPEMTREAKLEGVPPILGGRLDGERDE